MEVSLTYHPLKDPIIRFHQSDQITKVTLGENGTILLLSAQLILS